MFGLRGCINFFGQGSTLDISLHCTRWQPDKLMNVIIITTQIVDIVGAFACYITLVAIFGPLFPDH